MTGNKAIHLSLQERDLRLITELSVCRVVDREQASALAPFTSITRANIRLLQLSRAGLLNRFFVGGRVGGAKALYTMTPKAAILAEVPFRGIRRAANSMLVGDLFVEHQLSINQIFITAKHRPIPISDARFRRWLSFQAPLSPKVPLIPDGYFEIETPSGIRAMFCEVDHGTESLKVWSKKAEYYLRLATSGEFQRLFGQPQFRVLVVTLTPRRMQTIRKTVARLTGKVFWFHNFEAIHSLVNGDDFWSQTWLRPEGEQKQSLL